MQLHAVASHAGTQLDAHFRLDQFHSGFILIDSEYWIG